MKVLLEIIFLLFAFTYIGLMVAFNFSSPDNFINQELRPLLITSTPARIVFRLYKPGDARYEFVSPQTESFLIEVDYAANAMPHPELINWLEDMVQNTIGKPVQVDITSQPEISSLATFSDQEIKQLTRSTKTLTPSENQAYLHLIYIPESSTVPSNSGLVLTSNDIFIFTKAISGLSERDHILADIEESTIKHEWGHLLGLEHINQEDCIMSENVEVFGNKIFQGSNIPTRYCGETLFQINRLKQSAGTITPQ